jgi:RNA polymerase sigma factor (sigma-70 family)
VRWLDGDPSWQARFLRGDKDVMEQIYRDTFQEVRNAAGGVLREPADRDAVVHEVYLDLLSSRELRESHRGGKLGAWLGAIARHRALDFVRREGRLTELSASEEAAPGPDALDDFRRELTRFATRLEPQRRRLLELRYIAGMTQMEAAAAMGMSRSTLEDWERQLKESLHEFLAPDAVRKGKTAVVP